MIWFIIWLIGTFVAYFWAVKDWSNKQYEKYFFSMLWPGIIICWIIWYIHNKKWQD